MRRRWLAGAMFAGAVATLLSCGDVPTLADGIAYISPVQLPYPAVAVRDSLRNEAGVVTPIHVRAFDRAGNEISGVEVSYIVVPVDTTIKIDASGVVTAKDSTHLVQIIGRVGDRLQTTPGTLLVVPPPDSIARTSSVAEDTLIALPAIKTLPVAVSAVYRGTRVAVNGIIVRYRIDSLVGPSIAGASALLTSATGTIVRPDSTTAVDTTKNGGLATRNLVVSGRGVDSVYVSARATSLRGVPLNGSPVQFVLRLKR